MRWLVLLLGVLVFCVGCDTTPGVENRPPPPGGPPKQDRHPPGLSEEQQGRYK